MRNTDMTSTNRRNVRLASCENCRRRKNRCDHSRPVCGRCQIRGLASTCFYHPAPLTRPHAVGAVGEAHIALLDLGAIAAETIDCPPPFNNRYSQRGSSLPWPSIASDAHDPGFRLPGLGASPAAIHAEHVAITVEMLVQLQHLDMVEKLLNEYYAHSHAVLVPGALVLPVFSALRTHGVGMPSPSPTGMVESKDRNLQIAESIVQSTSATIDFDLTCTSPQFCALYTGKSLRLEAVGLIFALAGWSCLLGHTKHDPEDAFAHTMFRCSTCCLQIAREIAPGVNDPMVWLSYENLLLTMSIQGDASESQWELKIIPALNDSLTQLLYTTGPNVWRRLGDLSTDAYALGIHRESNHAGKIPFFLSECRRRTFAAAYHVDKLICTFFERPPRILRRFSDCKMPLDLLDDEVLAEANKTEQTGLQLGPEGWSPTPRFTGSTWARIRYVLGVFREEILEFPFRQVTAENKLKLIDLSKRSQESWKSLPEHLKYTHQCWTSDLEANVCLMLTIVYLSHLQNEFQIHRLLGRNTQASGPALLDVSAEIVAVVVQLGKSRDKAMLPRHDFSNIVVNYGLPSAAALVAAAQNGARTRTQSLPHSLSRSAIIRSLMLFTTYLEGISGVGETIENTCMQAAQSISRTVDRMLDEPPSLSDMAPDLTLPASWPCDDPETPFSPSQFMQTEPDIPGFPSFDLLNHSALDGFDLSGWLNTTAWAGKDVGH